MLNFVLDTEFSFLNQNFKLEFWMLNFGILCLRKFFLRNSHNKGHSEAGHVSVSLENVPCVPQWPFKKCPDLSRKLQSVPCLPFDICFIFWVNFYQTINDSNKQKKNDLIAFWTKWILICFVFKFAPCVHQALWIAIQSNINGRAKLGINTGNYYLLHCHYLVLLQIYGFSKIWFSKVTSVDIIPDFSTKTFFYCDLIIYNIFG